MGVYSDYKVACNLAKAFAKIIIFSERVMGTLSRKCGALLMLGLLPTHGQTRGGREGCISILILCINKTTNQVSHCHFQRHTRFNSVLQKNIEDLHSLRNTGLRKPQRLLQLSSEVVRYLLEWQGPGTTTRPPGHYTALPQTLALQ